MKTTSISLGSHYENFINRKVSQGHYNNANEVILAGLRLLEEDEERVIALKNAIQEGIDSGFMPELDPKDILKMIKKQNIKDEEISLIEKGT